MRCVNTRESKIAKSGLLMVLVLGASTLSCGRAIKEAPAGLRNNFKQDQTAMVPANAVATITKKNPAMIGGYSLNTGQCKGISGPDAGDLRNIQLLDGYREVLVVDDADLTIAGGLGTCTYLIKLGLAGITDQSVYVQVAAFHAYENSVDVTASLSTNSTCSGVIPNLSGAYQLMQIDYSFNAATATFVLDYPVSSGSYCGEGNREIDTYVGNVL